MATSCVNHYSLVGECKRFRSKTFNCLCCFQTRHAHTTFGQKTRRKHDGIKQPNARCENMTRIVDMVRMCVEWYPDEDRASSRSWQALRRPCRASSSAPTSRNKTHCAANGTSPHRTIKHTEQDSMQNWKCRVAHIKYGLQTPGSGWKWGGCMCKRWIKPNKLLYTT